MSPLRETGRRTQNNLVTCLYDGRMCSGSGGSLDDGSKQLPALHTVECSMYWTLAGRSSGENASLFRDLPLVGSGSLVSVLGAVPRPETDDGVRAETIGSKKSS